MFRSSHWGVLVVDALSGDTLYSRNAGKLFMPASNQKLLTGATALAQLGPDFRFETRVLGAAYPVHGILTGDLAIVGTGDPTFSDSLSGGDAMAPLRMLADSIAARGITEITGRLVRGGDAFPDSALGYGWAWDDLDYSYSAPVDELFFNEGYARVTVVGGAVAGAPVTVRTSPARTVPRIGTVEVTTTGTCTARSAGSSSRRAICSRPRPLRWMRRSTRWWPSTARSGWPTRSTRCWHPCGIERRQPQPIASIVSSGSRSPPERQSSRNGCG